MPLGAYWKGRKPLILNKACILGCLLPVTDNPARDLAIFEKLMAMDDESFVIRWKRRPKPAETLSTLRDENLVCYFDSEPPGALHRSPPTDWSRHYLEEIKVQWPGSAHEPSVRSRVSSGGGIHRSLAETDPGRRVHENSSSVADLFEFCLWPRNGGKDFAAIEREAIKSAVKKREIRLVVATDAACEGLNLQTLGTLINVDLPWNPSRLEQRLGRIKRFGQTRRTVNMLNPVYHETQDEKIYRVLSRCMKDRYDIFGGLPDTIEDEWIDSVERLEEMMDKYIHLRQQARDVFEMRYQETIDPDRDRWELCSRVLARRDVVERLSIPW